MREQKGAGYADLVKENPLFEKYYQVQKCGNYWKPLASRGPFSNFFCLRICYHVQICNSFGLFQVLVFSHC